MDTFQPCIQTSRLIKLQGCCKSLPIKTGRLISETACRGSTQLQRELWIPFEHCALTAVGRSPWRPSLCAVAHPVEDRPAGSSRSARSSGRGTQTNSTSNDRRCRVHDRVPMPGHVDELQVRRHSRIAQRASAALTSPLRLYSRHDRTPWRRSMLIAGCGFVPGCRLSNKQRAKRSGCSFRSLCSSASASPGAEMDAVMKATPTGVKSSRRQRAWQPAQPRSCAGRPRSLRKPVMP